MWLVEYYHYIVSFLIVRQDIPLTERVTLAVAVDFVLLAVGFPAFSEFSSCFKFYQLRSPVHVVGGVLSLYR